MKYYYPNKDGSDASSQGEGLGEVRLKVCGMKQNTSDVAALRPDYLGFIFWKPSKRFFEGEIPPMPHSIKKVGVFVDASMNEVIEAIEKHDLYVAQLHGSESPAFCDQLKKQLPQIKITKVFSVKDDFDFSALNRFEGVCDFYLFDTKGKLPGGNGYAFNWEVLKKYPSTKPYFLSGGIGLEEAERLKEFLASNESKFCHAIDVNSRFETEPGLKDIEKLEEFKIWLTDNHQLKNDT